MLKAYIGYLVGQPSTRVIATGLLGGFLNSQVPNANNPQQQQQQQNPVNSVMGLFKKKQQPK